jgi:hypothetical protein
VLHDGGAGQALQAVADGVGVEQVEGPLPRAQAERADDDAHVFRPRLLEALHLVPERPGPFPVRGGQDPELDPRGGLLPSGDGPGGLVRVDVGQHGVKFVGGQQAGDGQTPTGQAVGSPDGHHAGVAPAGARLVRVDVHRGHGDMLQPGGAPEEGRHR